MTGGLLILIPALLLGAEGALGAEVAIPGDFSRYAVILDRQPFGTGPAGGDAAAVPQDSFTTYVRLTALMQEEGDELRVGFVDKKQKDKIYMLGVGESGDDYTVLDADLVEELAKIRKGTEEQWLSMKTPGAASPPKRAAVDSTSGTPSEPVRVVDVRPAAAANPPGMPSNLAGLRRASRYAALRRAEIERQRLEENAKKLGVFREPPDKKGNADEDETEANTGEEAHATHQDEETDEGDDGEEIVLRTPADSGEEADEGNDEEDEEEIIREAEIQAHLQNYQKELIRQGLPPLPVPLTEKTDAELVKEGVLPPLPPENEDEE